MPASVDKKHDLPQEARNLVFMSSLAMNGEGRGIVIRTGAQPNPYHTHSAACGARLTPRSALRCPAHTGDQTMIGKIASLATDTATQRSTLQVEVHRLVWFVGILAFTIALILFVIG